MAARRGAGAVVCPGLAGWGGLSGAALTSAGPVGGRHLFGGGLLHGCCRLLGRSCRLLRQRLLRRDLLRRDLLRGSLLRGHRRLDLGLLRIVGLRRDGLLRWSPCARGLLASSRRPELRLQAAGELPEQLVADVLHDTPAELRRTPRDVERRDDLDVGRSVVTREELSCHRCRSGAVASLVLALGLDDGAVGGHVAFDESPGSRVLQGDRPQLHLDEPGEVVSVVRRQRGPREARRDPFQVVERVPRLIDGCGHSEAVGEVHSGILLDVRADGQGSAGQAPAAARTARRVSTVDRWRR